MTRSALRTGSRSNSTQLGFSFGNVLGIVANQYRSLMEAILEAIQNGLDANATKINVNINQKSRNVHVQDNGVGASKLHMDKCLSNIAKSQKDRGKLGQFGIGVVASFGKCRRFTFISQAKNSGEMNRWVFDCRTLAKATSQTSVPCVPVTNHDQWWSSELFIENYSKDQLRSAINFDQFVDAIYDRYGAAMLRNKCTIQVRLTAENGQAQEASLPPMDFTGDPLRVQTYDGDLCGKTTIRMFLVKKDPAAKGRKRKKKGQSVRLMDSTGYTIPLSDKVFPGCGFPKKDVDLLCSGHFEGEIIFSDKVQLDASRKHFEESMVTLEASEHITKWLDEVGRELVKKIEDEQTSARYQRLGSQSMKVIDHLLREQKSLADLVKKFKWGSQGLPHSDNSAKKDGKINATALQGGGPKKPSGDKKDRKDRKKGDPKPPRERPGHRPMAVGANSGASRTFTRHSSTGLLLVHQAGGKDLWAVDRDRGIITINTAHPTWEEHDTLIRKDETGKLYETTPDVRNRLVCHLQEKIILHALMVIKIAGDMEMDEDIFTLYAQEFVNSEHFLTTKADRIAKRGRFRAGRKPKKKEGN